MKKSARKMKVFIFAAILAAAATCPADGYRNPPDGALALGRIGGRIADIDDATAVSHNPANLAEVLEITARAAVTFGYSSKRFTDLQGNHTTSEDPWRMLPSLYAAVPLKPASATFGVGLNVPYGQATRWNENSLFRYTAPYYARMRVLDFSPSLGVRLNDRVSVGAGLDLYSGNLKFEQFVPWSMLTRNASSPDGIMKFSGEDYAVGGNAAIAVKINESQRAAFTYKLPFNMDYEGDFELSGIPEGVPGLPASDFETEVKYPQIIGFAYSARITDTVRIEANVEWLEHSRNRVMNLDIAGNGQLLNSLGTNSIAQDWKNTWTFGLGMDWQFTPNWQLRAGYTYMPTPVPQHTLMPSAAEQDQSVVSIGIGYRRERHCLDLALAQGLFSGREVRGNQNPAYNGDYDFRSTLLGMSYQYSF